MASNDPLRLLGRRLLADAIPRPRTAVEYSSIIADDALVESVRHGCGDRSDPLVRMLLAWRAEARRGEA